ncbi:hypothetical protein [Ferrimonas marina]|uniref:Adenylosuccinate synthase n=1 Tax=Ferrimonas marina TaxID=299255 RepID=A0A1M5UMN5_9GAMM|nr:hypothetical protein [Ferrimonas marina]SHH64217.1 hypothetical protein SAMN02745129_2640 [Ferrimonas marina]
MELTHDVLTQIAVRWLKRPFSGRGPGCHVALGEIGSYGFNTGEVADAFGYRYDRWLPGSVLVECKTSRSDFLADAAKPHRNGGKAGVGTYRYYMAPEGVIGLDDLVGTKWGLLTVNGRGHVRVESGHIAGMILSNMTGAEWVRYWAHDQVNSEREMMYLAHALRRVGDPQEMISLRRLADRQERQIEQLKRDLNRYQSRELLDGILDSLPEV